METLDGASWDVLISGTGIPQSLLALALSRSGKKVLHIDKNEYYGGAEAAFSLQEAEAWVEKVARGSSSSCFSNASISRQSAESGEQTAKLSFSRAYSLALAPQLIYTRSVLLSTLVSSKVYRQLEFLAVGSWWVYSPSSKSTDTAENPELGHGRGSLIKVPSGREDVFADQSISPRAKRPLMKFLRFVVDFENERETWDPHQSKLFTDFLTEQFNLSPALHDPLLALTLSPTTPKETTTSYALPRIARHLRSIGLFGPGFGSVIPKWGGLAEVAQVACRAGAVGGAVYVLGKAATEVSTTSATTDNEDEGQVSSAPQVTVGLEGGETVKASWVVGCTDDLPSSAGGAVPARATDIAPSTGDAASRSISVVSSPLTSLFPPLAEGSPAPAGAVVVFPSGSLGMADAAPVHILVHSSETGECPAGQSVLYASTLATGEASAALLAHAVDRLLSAVDEQPPPDVLWSLQYEQRASSSSPASQSALVPPASSTSSASRILALPAASLDLAFDDAVLDAVKEVWRQVVGPDQGGFMQFEEREGVGGEEEDED